MMAMNLRPGLALLALLVALPVSGHVGLHADGANGLTAGFVHPFAGSDHVLAMFALGLWAAQSSGRALWAMPLTFVAAMTLGGVLAMSGVQLPAVEAGVVASVLALGLLVAFAVRLPIVVGLALTAGFALLHGHAHGNELPGMVAPITYVAGFVAATTLLQAAGLILGSMLGARRTQFAGACIALAGAALLAGI